VKINEEIRHLVSTAVNTKLTQFRQILSEQNVPEDMRNSILSSLQECPDHVSDTFEQFKTAWRAEKFLRDNFQYISPTTVKLGCGTFQYVSVIETVNRVRGDKTFQSMRKQRHSAHRTEDEDGFLLEDVEDGLLFKENKFFLKNPNALRKEFCIIFFCFSTDKERFKF
jgi:hypothetical protein